MDREAWRAAIHGATKSQTRLSNWTHVQLFVTPWTEACQASLSLTISRSLPNFMPFASVLPSSYLILWCPLLSALNLSQHRGLFQWVSFSHQMTKILEFQLQHQSFQWIFRKERLSGLISLLSKGLSGVPCYTWKQKDKMEKWKYVANGDQCANG